MYARALPMGKRRRDMHNPVHGTRKAGLCGRYGTAQSSCVRGVSCTDARPAEGRKEGSGLSYDEVRNRLEDMIMTEQFQRYLTDREEELSVTVVDRVYDTIKWN